MKNPLMRADCPACGMSNVVPADEVLIASLAPDDRIRFDCDDCGTVTKRVAFVTIVELVNLGMPVSLTEDDVIEFQLGMAQIDDLAGVARLEGADV